MPFPLLRPLTNRIQFQSTILSSLFHQISTNSPMAKSNPNIQPETSSQVAAVMVPLPAQGHLNQLLHLSRLLSNQNISVYFLGAATHLRQAKQRIHCSTSNIHFHEYPTIHFPNPLPNPLSPTRFPSQIVPSLAATAGLRRPVTTFVDDLSKLFRRVIVVYDYLMSYVVQDTGVMIPNAECYCFRSFSAFSLCSWELRDCSSLPTEVGILNQVPSVDGYYLEEFAEFLHLQKGSERVSSGEIFNSSRAIEGLYLELYATHQSVKVWSLGPFSHINPPTATQSLSRHRHECLLWLDKQSPNSVIFVSFGTTTTFSDEQIDEIAAGLERSGHSFIWVLRDADKGDIFAGEARKLQLPNGFEQRVEGRGLVLRGWSPQTEILSHSSTGGFMSHCGWNSCLESIAMGVPMAAWPMHSDQPGNAVLIVKVLEIGVEVKSWSRRNELVAACSVEKAVRELMESEEMRRRAAELGENIRRSGESSKEMEAFITHINR